MPAAPEVRTARADELDQIVELLSRAAFGPTVARLIAFPRASPAGDLLVARSGRHVVGAVGCLSFGRTGWIGALGVAPRARRRGLGSELARQAIDRLRARGVETVQLFATDMGRPVYERLGFEAEGAATAWRGGTGAGARPDAIRPLRDGDREQLGRLDGEATGEHRAVLLDALEPLTGLALERDGELAGWAARSPFGSGLAICARDPEAGRALMAAASHAPITLVLPDANVEGSETLRRWGFHAAPAAQRMRLGPPLAWRPRQQYGLFNLFWG